MCIGKVFVFVLQIYNIFIDLVCERVCFFEFDLFICRGFYSDQNAKTKKRPL